MDVRRETTVAESNTLCSVLLSTTQYSATVPSPGLYPLRARGAECDAKTFICPASALCVVAKRHRVKDG